MSATATNLDPGQILDAVPLKNESARVVMRGGKMVAYVPLRKSWITRPPFSLIFPVRSERGIELDAMGQVVFEACDGQTTVERIVEKFASAHHLRFHEARMSVTQFLRDLTQRGLIVIVGPADAPKRVRQGGPNRRNRRRQLQRAAQADED